MNILKIINFKIKNFMKISLTLIKSYMKIMISKLSTKILKLKMLKMN